MLIRMAEFNKIAHSHRTLPVRSPPLFLCICFILSLNSFLLRSRQHGRQWQPPVPEFCRLWYHYTQMSKWPDLRRGPESRRRGRRDAAGLAPTSETATLSLKWRKMTAGKGSALPAGDPDSDPFFPPSPPPQQDESDSLRTNSSPTPSQARAPPVATCRIKSRPFSKPSCSSQCASR